jgi:hypothetical protein
MQVPLQVPASCPWRALREFVIHEENIDWTSMWTYIASGVELRYCSLVTFGACMVHGGVQCSQGHEMEWFDLRYVGVLSAVTGALGLAANVGNAASRRECLHLMLSRAYVRTAIDQAEFEGIVKEGVDSHGWDVVQRLGCTWLRVIAAARTVQRAWREHHDRRVQGVNVIKDILREALSNPGYDACRRRLKREFAELT